MKYSIIATLVLLSGPAHAISPAAAQWDCGSGVTAFSGKGEFGAYVDRDHPRNSLNVKWALRLGKTLVWLDGKRCKQIN